MNLELNDKAVTLLKDKMCICIDDLAEHIHCKAQSKIIFFQRFINFLADLSPPHDEFELGDSRYYENDTYLNREIFNFSEKNGVERDTEEYFIVDSIRHAFISFSFGGLYNLYKHREAENWYPKVIIREQLADVNLDGELVIYRGTGKEEWDSCVFSQSWTLSEKVANDFAFNHYDEHDDYLNTERVVLKSRINACHVYHYDKDDDEQEVIIDERKLIDVPPIIISQKILR